MSYQSRADLAQDEHFRERVMACCKEQALIYQNDGRPDIAALADAVIMSSGAAAPMVELVAISPDFVDVTSQTQVEDGAILAAVQAQWPTYAALAYPAPAGP